MALVVFGLLGLSRVASGLIMWVHWIGFLVAFCWSRGLLHTPTLLHLALQTLGPKIPLQPWSAIAGKIPHHHVHTYLALNVLFSYSIGKPTNHLSMASKDTKAIEIHKVGSRGIQSGWQKPEPNERCLSGPLFP